MTDLLDVSKHLLNESYVEGLESFRRLIMYGSYSSEIVDSMFSDEQNILFKILVAYGEGKISTRELGEKIDTLMEDQHNLLEENRRHSNHHGCGGCKYC